jgi:hypothetical protein
MFCKSSDYNKYKELTVTRQHQQKRNEPLTLLRSTEMSFEEIEKQISII